METFVKFIETHLGLSFLIGFSIITGIIWLAIWCYKVIVKNKELGDKIETLPCSDHNASINRHTEKFDTISTALSEIKGQVEMLVKLSTGVPSKLYPASDYSVKHSPRTLNINGIDLYKKVEGEAFLQEHEDFLFDKITQLHPKTALDVENFAFAILRGNSDSDIFNRLKNWVYNAPTQQISKEDGSVEQKDVALDDVLFVISLPLRDLYLAKHPEIVRE